MQRIAIVGLGLIGGSLALALRRALPGLRIVGVDSDPRTRELALQVNAVDAVTTIVDAPFEVCDVVVLALPAQPLLGGLLAIAARMRPGAVLTDVCGAKERICATAAQQDRVVFVGAHPMAGTEFRGFAAAQAGLFAGCTLALCPAIGGVEMSRREATRRVCELWRAAGAGRFVEMTSAAHDEAVTYASHLPYLAAASVVRALAGAGANAPLARQLAAGGFRDTTRLAGDATVSGAAALNRFVPGAARALADRLRALADQLESDPQEALTDLAEVAELRRSMRLQ